MKSLGEIAMRVAEKPFQGTRSVLPANLPAKRPGIVNGETDYAIPARVWSSWIPAYGKRSIIRVLTAAERTALQHRGAELADGLRPFGSDERKAVEITLYAMVGGFRSMRQKGDDSEGLVLVLMSVLRDFPAWAIKEGCRRIAMNEVGLDPHWPPNDTEIHGVVAMVVKPYREALKGAEELLSAPVELPDPPRPTREEIEAKLGRELGQQQRAG